MKESIILQLTALADKNRLKIVQEIAKKGVITCADAQGIIDLSQPTASHHIKILTESGLIDAKKDGRHLELSLNKKNFNEVSKLIKELAI
jgi:ArsR family transcriptional regulator